MFCLLSVVCCLLFAVCCLLYNVFCLLSGACCLFVYCLLTAVCGLLSVVCGLLSVICYRLSVLCCLLYVVFRLLLAVFFLLSAVCLLLSVFVTCCLSGLKHLCTQKLSTNTTQILHLCLFRLYVALAVNRDSIFLCLSHFFNFDKFSLSLRGFKNDLLTPKLNTHSSQTLRIRFFSQ